MINETFFQQTLIKPNQLDVKDADNQWLATFTPGSYTVTMRGLQRTFSEQDPNGQVVSVTHTTWVRTLPKPFNGQVDAEWLAKVLAANEQQIPDILAIAMQYIKGAPALIDQNGLQIAGDASYGPEIDGKREERSDFNDYLGIPWQYEAEGLNQPDPNRFRCLDCSGFMRMVWGYRHSFSGSGYADTIPLSRQIRSDGSTIPRRSFQICEKAPGVMIVPNQRVQITDFSELRIGDLVFFNADSGDGSAIDHVGMFMGLDANRKHRFISSRKRINGPTMSDFGGKSLLEGTGLYAKAFQAVRRL